MNLCATQQRSLECASRHPQQCLPPLFDSMNAAALDMVLVGAMDGLKSTTPSNADRVRIRTQPLSENSAQLESDMTRMEM